MTFTVLFVFLLTLDINKCDVIPYKRKIKLLQKKIIIMSTLKNSFVV